MSGKNVPDRRDFLALGVGAFVVTALPVPFRRSRRLVRRSVPVMGTVADLAVVHRDEGWAHRALDAAVDELRRVERLMSRFRDDSDVGRTNIEAARRAVRVSSETATVLAESLAWSHASGGAFDPCLGRAQTLWDPARRREPPPVDEVEALAGRGLWRFLEVETSGTTPVVRFHDPDVSVDLGGIAKGFGVDAAARALEEHGIFHALVNVGGDLRALGVSDDGDPWRVGIRAPDDARRIVTSLAVSDGAVATSGDYLRSFEHGGRRYHHLLDPRGGEPRRTGMRTLTVTAGSCMEADAAATTAFGMPTMRAERILAAAGSDARIVYTG